MRSMPWCVGLLDEVLQRGDSPFEAGTFWVAAVTLIVAILTLWGVRRQIVIANRQIYLAREQLKAANRQLELARRELKAVEDDLTISKEVFRASQRRAKLYVTFGLLRVSFNGNSTCLDVLVHNNGDRLSEKTKVTILRPPSPTNPQEVVGFRGAVSAVNTYTDGHLRPRYNRVVATLSEPVFRDDPVSIRFYFPGVVNFSEQSPFGWRVVCEDGATPSLETYEVFSDKWDFPPEGVEHCTPDILLRRENRRDATMHLEGDDE